MFLGMWKDESGQDIAEYAIMLAVIATLTIAAIQAIGVGALSFFRMAAEQIGKVM